VAAGVRVSDFYELDRTQAQLSFVDVQIDRDARLFIDPSALRSWHDAWAAGCVALIQNFFETVIGEIRAGNESRAVNLMAALHEPNETRLGLSRGRPRGRAMGRRLARRLGRTLAESRAARTGLLEHLEDAALMVRNIRYDRISDIATNLIREPLIEFTRETCDFYTIKTEEVDSGARWNPRERRWESGVYVKLPRPRGRKLLLVPKVIVRQKPEINADDYYRDYIIEYLEDRELSNPTSALVHLLRDGTPHVYRKDLEEAYVKGQRKDAIVAISLERRSLLQEYHAAVAANPLPFVSDHEIEEATGATSPDCRDLLAELRGIPTGKKDATRYQTAIFRLLACLFSPSLRDGRVEQEIHDGLKRVDIWFKNWDGPRSFFGWLVMHQFKCANVVAECKNYSVDPENAEVDQLGMRFSPARGQVGFLVAPEFTDRDEVVERCRTVARDGHGYIVPLDYDDLEVLVDAKAQGENSLADELINRFNEVIEVKRVSSRGRPKTRKPRSRHDA
jgi:hypothetical protein